MNYEELQVARDKLNQQMISYLYEMEERCGKLLQIRDPINICNSIHGLRSLIGQLDGAAHEYLQIR